MDRRIEKTRQALRQALLILLREKPLEQIEIQEITDCANTARVTFYRHYATKEDLLLDVLEQIYQDLRESLPVPAIELITDFRQTPPVYVLFRFLEQDRLLYKKLFTGTASALIQQRIRHYIVNQVIQAFSAAPRYADMPIILIANHIASTAIGNVMWWLADDLPYSSEYMARITHWLAFAGVLTLTGRGDEITLPANNPWQIPTG